MGEIWENWGWTSEPWVACTVVIGLPFYGQFLRGGACGGADYGYVGAFGPAGGVDGGGVALAVLRQHPAAVEVVDLQTEESEGGEDRESVACGVGEEMGVPVNGGGNVYRLVGNDKLNGVAPLAVVVVAFAFGSDTGSIGGVVF